MGTTNSNHKNIIPYNSISTSEILKLLINIHPKVIIDLIFDYMDKCEQFLLTQTLIYPTIRFEFNNDQISIYKSNIKSCYFDIRIKFINSKTLLAHDKESKALYIYNL